MSMGYGYFSIKFYTNDGSPDADAAKRAYDWCMENYDWFKGENGDGSDIPPFLLSGNSFEANDDDYYADGLVIKGTNIPGDVDWLGDAAKEAKAARLVANVIKDYSESGSWANWFTEKVWIDGEERDSYELDEFYNSAELRCEGDSAIVFHLDYGTLRQRCGKFRNAKTGEIVLGGKVLTRRPYDEDYNEFNDFVDAESASLAFFETDREVDFDTYDQDSIDKKECVKAFVSEVKKHMSNDCEIDESDWTFEGFDSQPSFFAIYGKNPPTAPFMDCEDYARKLAAEIDLKNGIFHCTDKSATSVTIPDGFTKIGSDAFYGCKLLTSVVIPPSVTEIGSRAFYGCSSLSSIEFGGTVAQWDAVKGRLNLLERGHATVVKCADGEWQKPVLFVENGVAVKCLDKSAASVVIPEGVTEIGEHAFENCKSLSSVEIPEGVTEIGYGAFWGCSSLSSVVIPPSVTEIGERAFCNCKSLSSVLIPSSVRKIGESSFWYCTSLTSVEIPSSVTEIGEWAFRDCTSLSSVVIPPSVTEIGEDAFAGCTSLSSVSIPSSVTEIGRLAFRDCTSLSSVAIPSSVKEIGESAFSGCSSLSLIEFGGTAAQWEALEKDDNWNQCVPAKSVKCADGEAALEE